MCITGACIVLWPSGLKAEQLDVLQKALVEIDRKPIEENYLLVEETFSGLLNQPSEYLKKELEKILKMPETQLSGTQYWLISGYLLRIYEKSTSESEPLWLLAHMEARCKVLEKQNPCIALFIDRNIARWHVLFGSMSDGYLRFQKNYQNIIEKRCLTQLPFYYMNYSGAITNRLQDYEKLLSFHIRAVDILDSLKRVNPSFPAEDYYLTLYPAIANTYFQLQNYAQAIEHWDMIFSLQSKKGRLNREAITAINNIGVAYEKLGVEDSALAYYQQAYELAQQKKDSAWIGIAIGNIGGIYFKQQKYTQAIDCFNQDIRISLYFMEYGSACSAYMSKADAFFQMGNLQKARVSLDSARFILEEFRSVFIRSEPHFHVGYMKAWHERMAELLRQTQNFEAAFLHLDSASILTDSLKKHRENNQYALLLNTHRLEKELLNVEILDARLKRSQLVQWLVAVTLLCVLVLLAFVVYMYYARAERQKKEVRTLLAERQAEQERALRIEQEMRAHTEIAQLKQEKMEEQIALRERELSTAAVVMQKKAELMDEIKKRLDLINSSEAGIEERALKELAGFIQSGQLTEDEWSKFKIHFEQVHPGFFTKLATEVPTLSMLEIRICAYIAMNMDNKAIAGLLNISPDSLRVTRHRLRKKIGVATDKELLLWLTGVQGSLPE